MLTKLTMLVHLAAGMAVEWFQIVASRKAWKGKRCSIRRVAWRTSKALPSKTVTKTETCHWCLPMATILFPRSRTETCKACSQALVALTSLCQWQRVQHLTTLASTTRTGASNRKNLVLPSWRLSSNPVKFISTTCRQTFLMTNGVKFRDTVRSCTKRLSER